MPKTNPSLLASPKLKAKWKSTTFGSRKPKKRWTNPTVVLLQLRLPIRSRQKMQKKIL